MTTYKYFTEEELKCKCGCGESLMDDDFMATLDALRENVGEPFYITSAYRCPSYNDLVSSTGVDGPHTTGKAVDIKANSKLKFKIVQALLEYNISRLGVAKNFLHIDSLSEDDYFPEEVIWTY